MNKNFTGYKKIAAVAGLATIGLFLVLFPGGIINPDESGDLPSTNPASGNGNIHPDSNFAAGFPEEGQEKTPAVKYYNYFAEHGSRIMLFNFSADSASDEDLMVFAILNLPDYSYEKGNSKEEIDTVLTKYFGRTVKNYVTGMTEYVPGTDRIRATGWDAAGSNRLVLTKLLSNSDGSLTGYFDVYHIPEMYAEEDYEKFWAEIDDLLLSGRPGKYIELLRYKAIINFNEMPEADGSFYLQYNSIRAVELDSPLWGLYAGYEYDEHTFDPKARFAAAEAVFNGITTQTTEEQLLARLGEPLEIIEKPQDVTIATTTYDYGGVEYVFEGNSNTVTYIHVTHFQWKYGPRNIRVGEPFEDVLARFPQEQDYKTHPNSCFYGKTTYLEEGGAVYRDADGSVSNITVVPKGILPFLKIYFQDGVVSSYTILGATT